MRTVFLGYSARLSADEMLQHLDIDPLHEDGISKFEQEFGCSYIDAGSFEVYDRQKYLDRKFDAELIRTFLPFEINSKLLKKIDFKVAKCVFFLVTKYVTHLESDEIVLVGSTDVEKFDYELKN